MACKSPSVERAVNKSIAAKKQIEKLENELEKQELDHKDEFFDKIEGHLIDANVDDARQIIYNSDIKAEFTQEFSLEKIVDVIEKVLKAVAASTDPTVISPAMSPAAIESYADLVGAIAEAAKSSSRTSASLSFSMNRLSPGIFAFLSAKSLTIEDKETFGKETITVTAVYYRLMQSLDDVKNQAVFGQALIDLKNLINVKTLQAALTDELANGEITIDQWLEKDEKFEQMIKRITDRLDAAKWEITEKSLLSPTRVSPRSMMNQKLVAASVEKLSKMGDEFKVAIEKSQARISNYHF